MLIEKPALYKGNIFVDDRGVLGFNNEVDLSGIKRFYTVTNHTAGLIRAWHGHEREQKYLMMLSGSASVVVVGMSMMSLQNTWTLNWDIVFKQSLSSDLPTIYHIPAGYAHGIKLLTASSKIMILSTSTIEESVKDDIRFDYNPTNSNDPFEVKIR